MDTGVESGNQGRSQRGPRGNVRSPHVVGLAPRSIYGHDADERALAAACVAARGRLRPTYVVSGRKIVGITMGRGPFSDDVALLRVHPSRKNRYAELERVRDDMMRMNWSVPGDMFSSLSAGNFGRTQFVKTCTTAGVAANWYDLWPVGGNPGSGSVAGAAKTAVAWTDASTGAITHRGNVSTNVKHLISKMAIASANTMTLTFYDRVISYDQNPYAAAVNQTMTNTATAGRYNSGAPGLLITMCVCTVNGATATNITQLRYTNQAGTTLQSMPTTTTVSIIVSGAAPTATLGARIIAPSFGGAYMPLAAGDYGCRLINDYTPSAANTGTFTFVLSQPLTDLPMPVAASPHETDCVFQIPELSQIFDGACISLFALQIATTAYTLQGNIRYGWG